MHIIYPDSNALYNDPYWSSPKVQALRDFGNLVDVEVWFSPVVHAELERERRRSLDEMRVSIHQAVRKFTRKSKDATVDDAFGAFSTTVDAASEKVAGSIYDEPWASILDWPAPTARQLVERELALTPPFSQAGNPTEGEIAKGYRDTMIWLGLLDAMNAHPEHTFVFVTDDGKGFLKDNLIHPHLLKEMGERGIDAGKLQHFRDIATMAKGLEPVLDFSLPRDVAAGVLIGEWAENESEDDLIGTYDSQHEISFGLGMDMETHMETEGELEQWVLEINSSEPAEDGNPNHWLAKGRVYFNAPVYKSEYYSAPDVMPTSGDTYLVDEINDHYFLMGFEREIEVVLNVDTSSGAANPVTAISGRVVGDEAESPPKTPPTGPTRL